MVSLEIKQRLRSRRWMWGLVAWFILIGIITALTIWSMYRIFGTESICLIDSQGVTECDLIEIADLTITPAGPMAFSIIVMFILGMGLVVAPAFTATSINGDRGLGIMATLQATRLSAVEIVGGKLIAAWLTAATFLVVALPFIVVSMVLGSISVLQVIVCFIVIFLLIAVVCAIGLGWSSVFTRAAASTVMTYVSTVILAIISPMIMAMCTPFIEEATTVRVWGLSQEQWDQFYEKTNDFWEKNPNADGSNAPLPPVDQCQWNTEIYTVTRMDRVWWMLVPNPFIIVADASPLSEKARQGSNEDLLSKIRQTVRELSRPPALERDSCVDLYGWNPALWVEYLPDGTTRVVTHDGVPVNVPPSPVAPRPPSDDYPVWPWGLGMNLILGGIFFAVAVTRLKIPYAKLAKGTRVA
jgi:ABC-type transport system involved in multi-copper enzyme maturation permease subunit